MDSGAVRAQSREDAKKAKSLPESTQFAIIKVLPNIRNGAFWGFTDRKAIEDRIEALKGDKNITARLLGNACLIEVSPAYMIQAVQAVNPSALSNQDVAMMSESRNKAVYELEHFLIRKGKVSGGFGGTIGIYCVNDVTTISYKGVTYPAFRVSMEQLLQYLAKYGYQIRVGNNFVPASQAGNAGQELWSSTKLSPTKTGIFVDIKSTYSPEQMKQLEQQFKQSKGLK